MDNDRIIMTSRAGTNICMKILLEEKMSKVILETLMAPAMIAMATPSWPRSAQRVNERMMPIAIL